MSGKNQGSGGAKPETKTVVRVERGNWQPSSATVRVVRIDDKKSR